MYPRKMFALSPSDRKTAHGWTLLPGTPAGACYGRSVFVFTFSPSGSKIETNVVQPSKRGPKAYSSKILRAPSEYSTVASRHPKLFSAGGRNELTLREHACRASVLHTFPFQSVCHIWATTPIIGVCFAHCLTVALEGP